MKSRLIKYGLVINLILSMIGIGICWIFWQGTNTWQADFTNFYTAWAMVRDGQGQQLYNLELQAAVQQSILNNGQEFTDGVLPYSNPPHAVFPFLPLAWLPLSTAYGVWAVINIGILLGVLYYIIKTIAISWTVTERWFILLIPLGFIPVTTTLVLGAFSILVAASLVCAILDFERGRDIRGAVWLFIASIKFPLILLPALCLLGGGRWKAIATGLGLSAVAWCVTGIAFGFSIWEEYLSFLQFHNNSYGRFGIDPLKMYNFKGLLANLLGMDTIATIATLSTVALLMACMVAIGLMIKQWEPSRPQWKLRLAFSIALGVFFNLHLYTHDNSILLVAAWVAYRALRDLGASTTRFGGFLIVLPALFFSTDWVPGGKFPYGPISLNIILTGWLGWLVWQHRNPQPLAVPE